MGASTMSELDFAPLSKPAGPPDAYCDPTAFQRELTSLIPQLRAFARSLCRDPSRADDLAQDALASAWKARATYKTGTNLRAWVYLILRNRFYSDARRAWRSTSLSPEIAEATIVARDNVECILELDEVRRAMAQLTDQHREALILVGVGGFSYDEAAEILNVPAGTVKSRVCRARLSLASLLATGGPHHDGKAAGAAFDAIVSQLATHTKGYGSAAARDQAA
jgi:RNA polymerase sigma-70 factor (ECF subfamily)